jgi:predicted PurR-regulated permease PerM
MTVEDDVTAPPSPSLSPKWGSNVKLIVGLSLVAVISALLIYFRQIIGPLLLAFILTYLLHPVAARLSKLTRLSWRWAVNLIYLVVFILLGGFFTASGVAVVQQIQNLIDAVREFINDLPGLIAVLSTQTYAFGPFHFDLSQFDLPSLADQLLANVQPLLGRIGALVGTFAASAATTLVWAGFVLIISYFLLVDASRVPEDLIYIEIPGYDADVRRLGRELRRIWNAFLRGQLTVIVLVIICYTVLLTVLGVRYSLAIALLAGIGRLVPYVGPAVMWVVIALVTFFQHETRFVGEPWQYTLMVLACSVVLDQIFDNLVSPRLLGDVLGVHPAAVLIGAVVATNLIGIVGLVLVAPALASLKLVGNYMLRKMLDLDPWQAYEQEALRRAIAPQSRWYRRLMGWLSARLKRG